MQILAYREEHVLLVLIDGSGVGHGVGVFDDRDGFTYKDDTHSQSQLLCFRL